MSGEINTRDVMPKKLPDKKPGCHRFLAIASFIISHEAAKAAHAEGGDPAILDQENLWDVSVGCVDCEEPYGVAMKMYCPGPEFKEKDR